MDYFTSLAVDVHHRLILILFSFPITPLLLDASVLD